ncbi:MAG: hypothetical protein AAFY69_15825, partial [Pseudomonadota bacterium]
MSVGEQRATIARSPESGANEVVRPPTTLDRAKAILESKRRYSFECGLKGLLLIARHREQDGGEQIAP